MDRSLAAEAGVFEFNRVEEAARTCREVLDPADAAELLVAHAVVPLCDEGLLDRVLCNARRISEAAPVTRTFEPRASAAPMAWQSPQLQSAFAPPRGAV